MPIYNNTVYYSSRETATTVIHDIVIIIIIIIYGHYILQPSVAGLAELRIMYTKHVIRLFSGGSLKDLQRTTCMRILMYSALCGQEALRAPLYFRGKVDVRHVRFTTLQPHNTYFTSSRVHIKTQSRSPPPPRRRKIYFPAYYTGSATSDDASLDIIIYDDNNNVMSYVMCEA